MHLRNATYDSSHSDVDDDGDDGEHGFCFETNYSGLGANFINDAETLSVSSTHSATRNNKRSGQRCCHIYARALLALYVDNNNKNRNNNNADKNPLLDTYRCRSYT